MSFRYNLLFYHENQKWVPRLLPLVDIPLFHLTQTDSESVVQEQIREETVDIIVSGMSTLSISLPDEAEGSMDGLKKTYLWDALEQRDLECPIILLCTHQELATALGLVQHGLVTDYFIADPLIDKDRLFLLLMRSLELALFREIVYKRCLVVERLPKHLLERIETLQELNKNSRKPAGPVAVFDEVLAPQNDAPPAESIPEDPSAIFQAFHEQLQDLAEPDPSPRRKR